MTKSSEVLRLAAIQATKGSMISKLNHNDDSLYELAYLVEDLGIRKKILMQADRLSLALRESEGD